ncbi:MAG: alpha/beta hydrolase [Proteobacteria bacterium]|nr:alpha/beta hydrolase [Pseudomonadota bacterium]
MINKIRRVVSYGGRDVALTMLEKGGKDELIVYLHGLGGSSEAFKAIMEKDGLCGYAQVSIDMIGYGDSDRPGDFSYSMKNQATILELVLEQYDYDKFHIVMHSMGGAMGLFLALGSKEKIASIVNMEGNLIASDCGFASKGTSLMSFAEYKSEHEKMVKELVESNDLFGTLFLAKADAYGFHTSAVDLVRCSESGELLEIFNSINVPKMYIHGERDRNDEVLPLLSEDIAVVEIPDAGHVMQIDNPAVFYEVLDKYISTV